MARLRAPATAILVAALLAGCGPVATASPAPPTRAPVPSTFAPASPTASASTSVDASAVYAEIAQQVEAIRGLRPKAHVSPVLIDEAQLRANLSRDFDRDNPAAQVQASEDVLVELGLLPSGTSLRQTELDLEAGQVAGYYSPDADELFVVSKSGGIGPTQRVTYAHEFTHQLQDQNFDLASLGFDTPDQGDRSLARLALVEGDAVTVQTTWTLDNLSAQDLAQLLADASDPVAIAALEAAPPFLRSSVLFPYTAGQAFVGGLIATGGEKAVDDAFGKPPGSTAQVLHPELYDEHVEPVTVTLPADLAGSLGTGWRELGRDTLGELQLRTWLESDGVATVTAEAAATGWAGDRLAVFSGPNDALALAIRIDWLGPRDAAEFATAAATALGKASGSGRVANRDGSATTVVVVAPTEALGRRLLGALGE